MGRRVSMEKSHKRAGSHGGEGEKDYTDNHAARRESSGETQTFLRSALVPRKQWPSNSEYGVNTGMKGSPSFYSASTSNSSSELASQISSRDIRSPSRSSQIDHFDSTAKSLFSSTTKALKRHASKLSLASSISFDRDDEGKVVWKLSAAEHESIQATSARKDILKRTISAPFNFKHVTHTYQEQVRGLERASRNELISEFSAIRAGQRADPQLRGIKAQSLRPQENSALPDSTESKSEPPSTSTDVTSPGRPPCAQHQHSPNGSNTASDGRCSRVSENFSRPVSKTSFSPISPPKRISSLNAFNSVIGVSQDAFNAKGDTHSSGAYSQQISRPAMNPASSPVSFILPSRDRDNIAVGHAISTADDSARHLKTSPLPMLPVDLDDVPEDEEGFIHSETDTSPVECGNRSLALRHAQSFPSIRPDAIQNDSVTAKASDVQRHTTSLDEGHARLSLDDGTSNWSDAPHHQPRRDTKRFSVGLKPMCETEHWEEDVDYCYEHAAEAESDFDWDQQVANFPAGLLPSVFDSSDPVEQSLTHLQKLAGLRKHDSQESSVLSIASSIADISASTNSVASLPELAYSVNSSRESMDWEITNGNKRHSKPAGRSQPASPAKSVKPRQGLGLSYSLFPSTPTPPRTP